jgi:hypothetical protein
MVVALMGFGWSLLGQIAPTTAAGLLRYYWFRMADVVVPLSVALLGCVFVQRLLAGGNDAGGKGVDDGVSGQGGASTDEASRRLGRRWLAALVLVAGIDLLAQAPRGPLGWLLPGAPPPVPRSDKNLVHHDWVDVNRWIARHTPRDALLLTPRTSSTSKWHSGRSEVVTWKDVPQDAPSIVQWWDRVQDVFGRPGAVGSRHWYRSLSEAGVEHLNRLAERYGADYAVVELRPDVPRLPASPAYENASYAVYRLPLRP